MRWTFDSLPTYTYELTVHADQILDPDEVQLSNDVVQTFDIVRGDVNRGGGTTVTDVVLVGSQHGQTSSQAFAYDLNGTGEVSVTDVILAGRYVGDERPSDEPPELLRVNRQGPGTTVSVSKEQLRPINAAAVDILVASGLPAAEARVLREDVTISFASLPGDQLGTASGLSVELDASGGGWGWFVDPTPEDSDEFRRVRSTSHLVAQNPVHQEQVDLLTVVLHELGHLIGEELVDDDHVAHWMSEEIVPGIRRLPTNISGDVEERHEDTAARTADSNARTSGRRLRRARQSFS